MRWQLRGSVADLGFAAGDRLVVADWQDGPLGAWAHISWTRADGTSVLLAPDDAVARVVQAKRRHDDVVLGPVKVRTGTNWIEAAAGPIEIQAQARTTTRLPKRLPTAVARFVEAPALRLATGLRGEEQLAPGVRAVWIVARYGTLTGGWATAAGADLGKVRPGTGRQPHLLAGTYQITDQVGQLDEALLAAARRRVAAA